MQFGQLLTAKLVQPQCNGASIKRISTTQRNVLDGGAYLNAFVAPSSTSAAGAQMSMATLQLYQSSTSPAQLPLNNSYESLTTQIRIAFNDRHIHERTTNTLLL